MKNASVAERPGLARAEARLEESLVALFSDRPELCGFTVASDGALLAADIGVYPPPDAEGLKLLCEDIRAALREVVDERPEAAELLAGRTFARSVH